MNQDSLIVFVLNWPKSKGQEGISVQAQSDSIFLASAEVAVGEAQASNHSKLVLLINSNQSPRREKDLSQV